MDMVTNEQTQKLLTAVRHARDLGIVLEDVFRDYWIKTGSGQQYLEAIVAANELYETALKMGE